MDFNDVDIDQEFTEQETSKQEISNTGNPAGQLDSKDPGSNDPEGKDVDLSDESIMSIEQVVSPKKRTPSPVRKDSPQRQISPARPNSPVKRAASPTKQTVTEISQPKSLPEAGNSTTVEKSKDVKDPATQIWSLIKNTVKQPAVILPPKSSPAPVNNVDIDYLKAEKKFNEFELKFQSILEDNKRISMEKEELIKEKKDLEQQLAQKPAKSGSDPYELELVKKELLLAKQELNTRSTHLQKVKRELESQTELALRIQGESSALSYKVTLREEELRSKSTLIEKMQEELNQKNMGDIHKKQQDIELLDSVQRELSQKTKEYLSSESRANSLQTRLDTVEQDLQAKQKLIRDLQNEKLAEEQQFLDEINSQKKLTQVYETQYNQVINDNEDLKKLVQELDEHVNALQESQSTEKSQSREALMQAQQQIEQQQVEIEKLKEELKIVNSDLLKNNVSVQIGHISGTAAAASQIQKSGKTITEMFTEYSRLQQELVKERAEVSRLNECLAKIVSEFEERVLIVLM